MSLWYIYLGLKLPQLSKIPANVPWLTLLATFQDCILNVDHCCLTQLHIIIFLIFVRLNSCSTFLWGWILYRFRISQSLFRRIMLVGNPILMQSVIYFDFITNWHLANIHGLIYWQFFCQFPNEVIKSQVLRQAKQSSMYFLFSESAWLYAMQSYDYGDWLLNYEYYGQIKSSLRNNVYVINSYVTNLAFLPSLGAKQIGLQIFKI